MRYSLDSMLPERAFQTVGGKLISLEGGGGGGKAPSPPPPPPPPPPQEIKQPEKLPEAEVVRAQNKNRMAAGPDAGTTSTLLTGPGGVDPNALSVDQTKLASGKNNLLGA